MRHILLFILSLLFLIPPTFVLADEYGVLFRRKVHGQMGWFKDGDQQHNEKYQGEIKNGKPNGSGKLTHPKGGNYEGGFSDGLPHGLVILDLLDGKKYDGEWIKGIKEGQGACTFADGSCILMS